MRQRVELCESCFWMKCSHKEWPCNCCKPVRYRPGQRTEYRKGDIEKEIRYAGRQT